MVKGRRGNTHVLMEAMTPCQMVAGDSSGAGPDRAARP